MFKEFFEDDFEHSSKIATKVLVDYTLGTPKYSVVLSVMLLKYGSRIN